MKCTTILKLGEFKFGSYYANTIFILNSNFKLNIINFIKRNIWTKCNSLTLQFIGISTTIDTWATCFDSYRVTFRPSKNTDPISKVVKCTVGFFEGLKMNQ